MAEITRLSGCSDWFKLDFVERERTPSEFMKLSIRYPLSELSLSNTVRELGEVRCPTLAESGSRLGSEGRSIARQRCKPGSHCVRRDGDPGQWSAILAVRSGRSRDEQIPPYSAVYDHNDSINTDVFARTPCETRCVRGCVSHRSCISSFSCVESSRTPISDYSPWKSECCRTYLPRNKMSNLFIE